MKPWLLLLMICFAIRGFGQDIYPQLNRVNTDSIRLINLISSTNHKRQPSITNKPLTVFVFLSPECPLSLNYTKSLTQLATTFNENLSVIGIIPGSTYKKKTVRKFIKDYNLNFDIYLDPDIRLSELFTATVTPEVVLIDSNGVIHYRGAIDDWAVSIGRKKAKPTILYLHNAVDQVLSGGNVIVRSTKPVGCLINDY